MTVLLTTLGVAALLLVGLLSAVTLTQIRRLRFTTPQTELLDAREVPEAVRAQLAQGLAHLDALGFAHPAALRQTSLLAAGRPQPQHGLVLVHRAVPAAGCVFQLPVPDRGRPWGLFFSSRNKDGRTLVTRNRASVAGPIPLADVITQDCWLPDWAQLWQAHQRRMKALEPESTQWQGLSPAAWVEAGGASERAVFQARLKQGDLVAAGDGSWRFGPARSLQMLWAAWRTARASSRGMAGDTPVAAAGQSVEDWVEHFERDATVRQGSSWSQGAKWLPFFVTAAAAAASFGFSMDLGAVPALVAVLLFHELGHFAAMRWAGYRDLKVFFLPFLGAAVSGRHDSPSATQELIVLFAGPVPGLVLGLAALWGLPPDMPWAEWLHSCAALAVTINAFNLLPIHPLDGGKIFEILLLGRWPWLAFAGRVLGIVAFAGLALTMDSDIGRGVLWGLVLLMALRLGHQRQEARLAAALRAEGRFGGQTRAEALRALFAAMKRLGLGVQAWATQRVLAQALLPAMTRPRLTRVARGGGLAVYAFFLFLPVLALVGSIWSASRGSAERAARVDKAVSVSASAPEAALADRAAFEVDALFASILARVNAEPDPARRWALLVGEFGAQTDAMGSTGAGRLPAAQALLRQAEELAAQQADTRSAQAQVAFWQAEATAEGPERQQRLQALMARYDDPATAPADRSPLLHASLEWLYAADRAQAAERGPVIDRALAQAGPPLPQMLGWPLREFKVELLLGQGEAERAGQLVREWFDAALSSPDGELVEPAARLRVDWMLLQQGPAAALRELDTVLLQLAALPPERRVDFTSLRRHGMHLAELAGRGDWQRAQVAQLPKPDAIDARMPWWARVLLWTSQGGSSAPPSWMALEHLHWLGDTEGAARVATALQKRHPGALSLAPAYTEGLPPLAAARLRLHSDARRAVAQRYGMAVPPAR